MKPTDEQLQNNNYIMLSNWLNAYLFFNRLPLHGAEIKNGEDSNSFIISIDVDKISKFEIKKLSDAWEEATKPLAT